MERYPDVKELLKILLQFNRSHQTVKIVAKYLVDGIDGCIEELIKCHK